jgi:hypothetical protein
MRGVKLQATVVAAFPRTFEAWPNQIIKPLTATWAAETVPVVSEHTSAETKAGSEIPCIFGRQERKCDSQAHGKNRNGQADSAEASHNQSAAKPYPLLVVGIVRLQRPIKLFHPISVRPHVCSPCPSRQSLDGSAFPSGAWEREYFYFHFGD